MKAPGARVIEFEITPIDSEHTGSTLTAYRHPAEIWGMLYWYAFAPSLFMVFHGMARAIALRAETACQAA